jgi:hypothetical protein
MTDRTVFHPQFGSGTLLKTYMGGFDWEVQFASGRRFRLPAREFTDESRADNPVSLAVMPPFRSAATPDDEQFRARQTLEALRTGIVPVQDAETLTIGMEPEKVTLERALQRAREYTGDVLAVIGDYGYGKSHFIELAARRAARRDFLVASASLDLKEVPPGKPDKIFAALVASLRYPDHTATGLAPLLRAALDNPPALDAFLELCPAPPEQFPLAAALIALRQCPNQAAFDEAVLWLSLLRSMPVLHEFKRCLKRPPRLYTNGETARQYVSLLSGISTLARLLGYSGLAVLIDESEHYSLLTPVQRQRADSFFMGMIAASLGEHTSRVDAQAIPQHARAAYPLTVSASPHLFFLFALTENQDRMPIGSWLEASHFIRLDDRFIEQDIRTFFNTLKFYHSTAHAYDASHLIGHEAVLNEAAGLFSRSLSQHRINLRQLIRGAVSTLDMLMLYPDYPADALLGDLRRGLNV